MCSTPTIEPMYLDNWFAGVQRSSAGHRRRGRLHRIAGQRHVRPLQRQPLQRRPAGRPVRRHHSGVVAAAATAKPIDKSHYNGVTAAARVEPRRHAVRRRVYLRARRPTTRAPRRRRQRPDANGPAAQDKGPSDVDIRHKLSLSGNWMIPGPTEGMRASRARRLAGGGHAARPERHAVLCRVQRSVVHSDPRRVRRASSATAAATTTPTARATIGRTCRRLAIRSPA